MSTVLARRLEKLEASAREDLEQRWATAVDAMRATLDPEHGRLIRDWLLGPHAPVRAAEHGHDTQRVCRRCVFDEHPPALVRAALLILIDHLTTGAPVVLPSDVAEVYLNDSDAYPTNPCEGCRYLMPTQSTIGPDGTYRHRAGYLGACPACGLDNHPEQPKSEDAR